MGRYTEYAFPTNGSLTPYGTRGKYILDYVLQSNDAGMPLPLFAICKGESHPLVTGLQRSAL